ncbi:MAG: hypothetical protein WA076_06135 [Lactococcus raffinolactis]
MRELKFLLNRWALMQRDIEEPFNRTSLEKLYKALNVLPNDERIFLAKKYLNNSGMLFSDTLIAGKEELKPIKYTRKRANKC